MVKKVLSKFGKKIRKMVFLQNGMKMERKEQLIILKMTKMLVFCLLCPLLLDFLALYSKKRSPLFGDALSLRHMTIYSLNIIDLAFYSLF
mgnify:CR=1 FL=1